MFFELLCDKAYLKFKDVGDVYPEYCYTCPLPCPGGLEFIRRYEAALDAHKYDASAQKGDCDGK